MSYKLRTIIGVIVLEIGFACLWYWLLLPDAQGQHHWNTPDGPAQVGRIMGTIMGGLIGISPLLLFMAHSNDKRRGR